jgi:hypothetical protein
MTTREVLATAIVRCMAEAEGFRLPSPGDFADAVMAAAHNMTIEDQATLIGGSRSQKTYTNPDGTTGRIIWVTRSGEDGM